MRRRTNKEIGNHYMGTEASGLIKSADSPSQELVTSYVADVVERSHAVQHEAEKLASAEDYVSPEAPLLIKALSEMVGEVRKAVIEQWRVYVRTQRPQELTLLRGMDERLRTIAGELRLPGRAISKRVPGVLTRLVAKKASELQQGAGVILRPQWNYNFKIHRDDVHAYYTELMRGILSSAVVERCLRSVKRPLYIISFPFIERSSVHLHSLLGHELGHLMARAYVSPTSSDAAFSNSIFEKLRGGAPRGRNTKMPYQLTIAEEADLKRAFAARQKGVKEFASDAASVYLFGIAALLGATQVAMARGLRGRREAEDRYYPTWGSRLSHMLSLAREGGWLDLPSAPDIPIEFRRATEAVTARISQIEEWVGADQASSGGSTDMWIEAGHQSARALLPDIHRYLRERFSASFADRGMTYERLPGLFDRLRHMLPPDNVGPSELALVPPSLENVFAASWWYRLWKVKPRFKGDDVEDTDLRESARLRRLTLKAIENIDLVDRFQDILGDLK
jgi:hypothetical protein